MGRTPKPKRPLQSCDPGNRLKNLDASSSFLPAIDVVGNPGMGRFERSPPDEAPFESWQFSGSTPNPRSPWQSLDPGKRLKILEASSSDILPPVGAAVVAS